MMVELLAGPLIGDLLSFEAQQDDAGKGAAPHGGELSWRSIRAASVTPTDISSAASACLQQSSSSREPGCLEHVAWPIASVLPKAASLSRRSSTTPFWR